MGQYCACAYKKQVADNELEGTPKTRGLAIQNSQNGKQRELMTIWLPCDCLDRDKIAVLKCKVFKDQLIGMRNFNHAFISGLH